MKLQQLQLRDTGKDEIEVSGSSYTVRLARCKYHHSTLQNLQQDMHATNASSMFCIILNYQRYRDFSFQIKLPNLRSSLQTEGKAYEGQRSAWNWCMLVSGLCEVLRRRQRRFQRCMMAFASQLDHVEPRTRFWRLFRMHLVCKDSSWEEVALQSWRSEWCQFRICWSVQKPSKASACKRACHKVPFWIAQSHCFVICLYWQLRQATFSNLVGLLWRHGNVCDLP